jgi:sensor histidine kinase YesM
LISTTVKYRPKSFLSEKNRLLHHFLFWGGYVAYSIFIHFFTSGFGGIERYPFIMLVDVATIYLNISLLIPRYLVSRRLYKYFSLTILSFAINVFLNFLIQNYLFNPQSIECIYSGICRLSYSVTTSFVFLILAVLLKLLKEYLSSIEKIKQLKETNVKSELDFLKTQVNPHFLFNTLNNIKVLIKINPNKAEDLLIKLSGLLRYQIYDCSEEKVLFTSELIYLQNYLDLQKIRVSDARIDFEYEGDFSGVMIYPFMFMPFIENAVKHGLGRGENDKYIKVIIKLLNKTVTFFVENSKSKDKSDTGGIGLVNIKRRLDLLYPNNYNLEFFEEKEIYKVKLKINLV